MRAIFQILCHCEILKKEMWKISRRKIRKRNSARQFNEIFSLFAYAFSGESLTGTYFLACSLRKRKTIFEKIDSGKREVVTSREAFFMYRSTFHFAFIVVEARNDRDEPFASMAESDPWFCPIIIWISLRLGLKSDVCERAADLKVIHLTRFHRTTQTHEIEDDFWSQIQIW